MFEKILIFLSGFLLGRISKVKENITNNLITDNNLKGKDIKKRKKYTVLIIAFLLLFLLLISLYLLNINIEYLGIEESTFSILFWIIFPFYFIIFIGVFLIEKIKNFKFIIALPFLIIFLLFIAFLIFGIFFYNFSFFITDYLNIINPYLMTFGFVFYGGLIGFYISKYYEYDECFIDKECKKDITEKKLTNLKNTINILIGIITIYLFLLLILNFSLTYLQNYSFKNYVKKSDVEQCLGTYNNSKEKYLCISSKYKHGSEISGILNIFSDDKYMNTFIYINNYNYISSMFFKCYIDNTKNKDINLCVKNRNVESKEMNELNSKITKLFKNLDKIKESNKFNKKELKLLNELEKIVNKIRSVKYYEKFKEYEKEFNLKKYKKIKIKIDKFNEDFKN